jgi:hypothetical protein
LLSYIENPADCERLEVSSGVHEGAPVGKEELEPGGLVLSHDAKVIFFDQTS